jgi:hypothetical protein
MKRYADRGGRRDRRGANVSWVTDRPRGDPPTVGTVAVPVARPWVGALAGLAVTVVGAWAAAAVFVGPLFGYRVTSAAAWHWSELAWMLHLAPGGVATTSGLLLLGGSSSSRLAKVPLGLLVVAAGAWLVVGPAAWGWVGHGAAYLHATSARVAFVRQAGAALGPGVLLVALGAAVASRPPGQVTVAVPFPVALPAWSPAPQPRYDVADVGPTASYPVVQSTAPLVTPPPPRAPAAWDGEPTAPGWGPPA